MNELKSSDVVVNSMPYERAHGQTPRGTGSWAFCPYDKYRRDDYLSFVLSITGSYTEAKRAAREHFAKLNVCDVVVCS